MPMRSTQALRAIAAMTSLVAACSSDGGAASTSAPSASAPSAAGLSTNAPSASAERESTGAAGGLDFESLKKNPCAGPCLAEGKCHRVEGKCVPLSREDCMRGCPNNGLCGYDAERRRCIAESDEDCAKSFGCTSKGACARSEEGACAPATDAHCKASSDCGFSGWCRISGGRCGVIHDGDCKDSKNCKEAGLCTALPDPDKAAVKRCLARDEAACRASSLCKSRGDCAVTPEHLCRPANDADCKASAACREKGLCRKGFDEKNPMYACVP